MHDQTVCLRKGKRKLHPVNTGSFAIEVPAHLAPDFGLSHQKEPNQVIQCCRPPQVGVSTIR
jgi:hypothetical protein